MRYTASEGITKSVQTKIINLSAFSSFVTVLLTGIALLILSHTAFAATSYNNGFETDTTDWVSATRVASPTGGVTASGGSYFAQADNGAYTKWGGYESTFPAGGYTTKVDTYLDMSMATGGGVDKRFDFSSAINDPSGNHRRDFIFSLGTDPNTAGQWGASVSNNAPGWPLDTSRSPITITDSGWYTLESNFHDDGTGVLAVTMSIVKVSDHSVVGSWTLSDPSDVIGSTVGGHRYGWLVDEQPSQNAIASVDIDNASLEFNNPVPACSSDNTTFDTFSDGSVDGQHDWKSTGSYDQAIVDNSYGYPTFGCKSLRLSNAVTTGSFGDQTFSYSTTNEAGEADSTSGGQSGGTRQNHYEAQFDIASTQSTEQSGLGVSVSPDRGDGSRMSYLSFADTAGGIDVTFYDVQGTHNPADFEAIDLGTISRTEPHTIKFVIDYLDGPSNDIVKIYIDGALVHTGTTWENYYRYDSEASSEQTPRTTDSLIFRAAGTAAPSTAGKGFLFDNVDVSTSTIAPPSVPVHVSPADGSYKTTANQTLIDWGDSTGDASPIKYKYESSHSSATNPNGSFTSPVYTSGLLSSSQIPTPGTPEGVYYWHVKAIDNLGNESDWSTPWKLTVDNTIPTTPSITFPSDNQYFTSTPILNDWTDSTDANGVDHYQIEYVYDDGHTFSGAPYRETPGSQSQRNHTPNTSEQGGVKIRVRAYDAAGNVSGWSNQVHYFYDATPPADPTLVSPSNNAVVKGASVTQAWSDTSGDVDHYIYESYNNSTATSLRYHNTYSATSKTATNVADTTFWWRVKAVDAAGNESGWSPLWKLVVDSTAPVSHITAPTDSIVKGTVTISGTVTDANPDHYYLVVKDASNHVVAGPGTVNAHTVADFNWDTTGVADGTYTIDLEARDAAGGTSSSGNKDAGSVDTKTVTVDNTAPDVTINGYSAVSNVITPDVTATDPAPGTALTYSWTPNDTDSTNNVTISDDTALEPDFTVLSDGTYNFTLTVTDAAGNSTSKTFSFTYTTPVVPTVTSFAVAATGTGGGTGGGGGTGFTNVTAGNPGGGGGQVLGATTTTPNTSNSGSSGNDGSVKGESTTKSDNSSKSSNFLGLGWWWLLIVAILALIIGGLLRKADSTETSTS